MMYDGIVGLSQKNAVNHKAIYGIFVAKRGSSTWR